ncbi:hypothetical protein LguiA_008878 [Lonicera macranthoides]
MATTQLLTASTHPLQPCSNMSLRINSSSLTVFKDWSRCTKKQSSISSFMTNGVYRNIRRKSLCLASMSAGESDGRGKINMDHIIKKATKLWDSSPQPIKSFPWDKALENFIELIVHLIAVVTKYLCIPVLAISSLSELSYCFHERRQFLVPFPLLVGMAAAGVLKETAEELSPLLKEDAKVPWHLIAIAAFFTLIKFPGPYYPYWGRILIPHFANGGLLRILWFSFWWYRRPQKASENGSLPEENRA